ncbi:MAG: hypothetical protein A2145_07015 [candidate division Zixibacteria bacterium RBG_16_40_9]|nr:MAG: hypothetical protein A2145_07015 [candidate division Zixibacteria bacterium RBG_16_40_9]
MKKLLKILDYFLILILFLVGILVFLGGFNLQENLRLPLGALFLFYGGLRFILIQRKYRREDRPKQ